MLEENGIKQSWSAKKLGKSYTIVNGYGQNSRQPKLKTPFEIALILEIKLKNLLKI